MTATFDSFPARAVQPKGGPVMLVTERASIPCGCAVYVGTIAGSTGQPSVLPYPCYQHEPRISEFTGYLSQAVALRPGLPLKELVRLAGDLLDATFQVPPPVGSGV